jgi:uncharacterized protein YjcR
MTTTQRKTKSETHNIAEDSGLGVKRELDERETEEGTKPTKKPKVEEKETGEQQSVYKSGAPLILDLELTFSHKIM